MHVSRSALVRWYDNIVIRVVYVPECTAEWSTCQLSENAICGQGSRSRLLDCVRSDGRVVELKMCEQVISAPVSSQLRAEDIHSATRNRGEGVSAGLSGNTNVSIGHKKLKAALSNLWLLSTSIIDKVPWAKSKGWGDHRLESEFWKPVYYGHFVLAVSQ